MKKLHFAAMSVVAAGLLIVPARLFSARPPTVTPTRVDPIAIVTAATTTAVAATSGNALAAPVLVPRRPPALSTFR